MLFETPAYIVAALLVALATDALFGEPDWLYRRVPHPAVLLGRLVAALEARLLVPTDTEARKRQAGVLLLLITVGIATLVSYALHRLLRDLPVGWAIEGVLMSSLLAQRSLVQHVKAVADGLGRNLAEGRRAVAMIVGRDPERLDEAGVGRGAVESLAENFSDGVIAPLFWGILAGLPGMVAYKAINTLDSMVGHKNARYAAFGWASARTDDVVNYLPARLSGLLLCLAGAYRQPQLLRPALAVMRRDAPRHRSPNAGWPEAAMAAILGVRLAGPRVYGGTTVEDAWMGQGRAEVTPADIRTGITVTWRAWWLMVAALGVEAVLRPALP